MIVYFDAPIAERSLNLMDILGMEKAAQETLSRHIRLNKRKDILLNNVDQKTEQDNVKDFNKLSIYLR